MAVFLEKPCCLNYEQTATLTALAAQKNLLVQVGYHNRYIGTFGEAKRLINEGALGEIYHFRAEAYGPVLVKEKEDTWRSQRSEGGGCLYDYSSHVINLVGFVLDDIAAVSGTRLESVYSQSVEDAVYSTLVLNDGTAGQLAVSWSEESYRKMTTSITISGKLGKIIVDSQELKLYLNSNSTAENAPGWQSTYLTDHTEPVWFYLRGEEYSAQINEFVTKVDQGQTDSVNNIASAGETDRVVEMLIADNERNTDLHLAAANSTNPAGQSASGNTASQGAVAGGVPSGSAGRATSSAGPQSFTSKIKTLFTSERGS